MTYLGTWKRRLPRQKEARPLCHLRSDTWPTATTTIEVAAAAAVEGLRARDEEVASAVTAWKSLLQDGGDVGRSCHLFWHEGGLE